MRFGVAGFRGIGRYQEVELAPITVVTGPNSAGKSSLLEALRVSRKLARDLDHQSLVGPYVLSSSGRFHPEYVFGGDIETKTLFEMTPSHLQDEYLRSYSLRRSTPGISIRVTVEPVRRFERELIGTTLELFDDHGAILDCESVGGLLKLNWCHPVYAPWLHDARGLLEGRTEDTELVEAALAYCCGGFEAASMFRWPVTHDANGAWFVGAMGPDFSYDERRSVFSLGEFALCELALSSHTNAEIARLVVEQIGVDDAIIMAMELDESPSSALSGWLEPLKEQLGTDLFNRLDRAVSGVDWQARDLYARLYTSGQSILQRVRSEVFRSLPHVRHVAAERGTPPSIIVEPPSRQSYFDATERAELESRVNTWLGSDKLGTGYRFVREQLVRASDASVDRDEVALPDTNASTVFQQYLVDLATGMRLTFKDVGYGLSQVMPVLLELYGRRYASLHIEQPESHLHPALQADLADAAIISVKQRHNQVALETHSEHLILRLLRRIRETSEGRAPADLPLTPSDVAIYYVAPGPQGATVTRIHVSEDGDFTTPWPAGFFPERLQELD